MNSGFLNSNTVKAKARSLGFVACGMAPALPLPTPVVERFCQWTAQGRHADMHYLARNAHLRFNPDALVPGVHTVISVALPYRPQRSVPGISMYAHGKDYHTVMRKLLKQLMQDIGATGRCFVDTAPVPEKYWAWRCGLGWQGRHTQLILPALGSTHFLGELFVHQQADAYDRPMAPRCGGCNRCTQACPTGALCGNTLDARRCLSYLTIEHRGPLPPDTPLQDTFYGCDRCLKACPHMTKAPLGIGDFQPSEPLLAMQPHQWDALTPEQYQALFGQSAVKRAGYEGLRRNIAQFSKQNGEPFTVSRNPEGPK